MKRLLKRPLSLDAILAWADAHRDATSNWPKRGSGDIPGTIGESWSGVDAALHGGLRGLPGGGSLARLLSERRGVRNIHGRSPLSVERILDWADAHHESTGSWPTANSGQLHGENHEHWQSIDAALRIGLRGLSGGSSLAQVLAEHRGLRNRKALPKLTEDQILAWADAHYGRT